MKALIRLILLSTLLCFLPEHCLSAELTTEPLLFGFLPSRSPISLFKHYKPLVDYVSTRLDRRIIIETAPNYREFLRKTAARRYDFALTAPHFALLAIDSGRYYAPITYTKGLVADILVVKSSPITRLEQLANRRIATPPESAIITMAGKYYLQRKGLRGSRLPEYRESRTHNDSIHSLLSGESDAAIVSYNVTRQFILKNAPLKKIGSTGNLPGMAILIARDMPKRLRLSFIRILTQMKNNMAGKAALKEMGYSGYRQTYKNEFENARPYIKMYMERSK